MSDNAMARHGAFSWCELMHHRRAGRHTVLHSTLGVDHRRGAEYGLHGRENG